MNSLHTTTVSQTITTKLKLVHTPEQKLKLDKFCFAYREGLNLASCTAFDNGKTSNKIKIQELTYQDVRSLGIGSQLACSIARDVGAKYKTQWTKLKQHNENKAKGYTKKCYKGLDRAINFTSRTATLQYKKDYSLSLDKQLASIPYYQR